MTWCLDVGKARDFSLLHIAGLALGIMLPFLFYGYRCLFLGVKWSGCEVDHLI